MSDVILLVIIAIQTALLITFVAPVLYRWLKPAPQPEIPPAICLLEGRRLNRYQLDAVMRRGHEIGQIREIDLNSPWRCYERAEYELVHGHTDPPLNFCDQVLPLLGIELWDLPHAVNLYVDGTGGLHPGERIQLLIWLVAGLAMNGIQADVYLWTQHSEAARAFAGPLSVVDATDGLSRMSSSTAA